jgi:hypothetical protein
MSNPIKFIAILFFIFLTTKLTGHIDWSWWWVTSPLWITASIVGVLNVIYYSLTTKEEREIERLRDRFLR